MSNCSICPIERTLSGATTLGQSGPENNGNKEVLCILQSSSITGASVSDCLVSYPGHLSRGGGGYPSVEMHSVYSTAPANWTSKVSGSKSPQHNRTLLSILADFNRTVVWIVLILCWISSSPSLFSWYFRIVQRAPIMISVKFMFHNTFYPLARFRYLFSF